MNNISTSVLRIVTVGHQLPVVGGEGLELPGEDVLLHLHQLSAPRQAGQLVHVGVPGHEVGDVVCHGPGHSEHLVTIHTAPALLDVKHLLTQVFWPSPGW